MIKIEEVKVPTEKGDKSFSSIHPCSGWACGVGCGNGMACGVGCGHGVGGCCGTGCDKG